MAQLPENRKFALLYVGLAVLLMVGWGIAHVLGWTGASSTSSQPFRLSGDQAVFCPDLPTLRRYVEEYHQQFGGDGCTIVISGNFQGYLIEQEGAYVHVRLVSRYGEVADGYMQRREMAF